MRELQYLMLCDIVLSHKRLISISPIRSVSRQFA